MSGPVYEVKPGKLRVTIDNRGSLESSEQHGRLLQRRGPHDDHQDRPRREPGSRRETSSASSTRRPSATSWSTSGSRPRAAKANYQNAKLAREVAELAVKEYTEGVLNQELTAAKAEIVSSRAAIQKAESKLERTRRAGQKLNGVLAGKGGVKTPDEIMADLDLDDRLEATEQTLLREKMTLELAQTKLELLKKYTGAKITKGLQIEVERKRSEELAKQAAWELEKSKEAKLERQIAACTLVAPISGLVVYANDPAGRSAEPAADRGRRDGPRAPEDHLHPRSHPDAGQRQGPRGGRRQDCPEHEGQDPRGRLLRSRPGRHGPGYRPPARRRATSSAGTSRSTRRTSRSITLCPACGPA